MSNFKLLGRRNFVQRGALGGICLSGLAGILTSRKAPAAISSDTLCPKTPWGLQVGDVLHDRAIVWSRSDRPARMKVEWSAHEDFRNARSVRGLFALESSDYTSRLDLRKLPAGEELHIRVSYESLQSPGVFSEPLVGRFDTAPRSGSCSLVSLIASGVDTVRRVCA